MSSPNQSGTRLFRFGVFEADLGARELRKRGVRVRLQEQPFRVLEALLEKPGEVVTREELKDRLWAQDEFVEFDKSLNTAVQKIRQALDDSAMSPRFLETMPKVGYRFVAPVESRATGAREQSHGLYPALAATAAIVAIGVFAFGWLLRTEEASDVAAVSGEPVPLTSYPGREVFPTFSPTGDRVAFAWEGENRDNWDVYMKLVGENASSRLTDSPSIDSWPSWSPDGRHIAFVRSDRETDIVAIMTVPAIGGVEREVFRRAGASKILLPGWGNEEARLLAWHQNGQYLLAALPREARRGLELFAIEVETGAATPLATGMSDSDSEMDPAVSSDGRRLAFRRVSSSYASKVFVADLSEDVQIEGAARLASGDLPAFMPAWSPDSLSLIFSAGYEGTVRFWRVEPPDGEPARVMAPRGSYPALSPVGDRMAFAHVRREYDLWRADVPSWSNESPLISSSFFDLTPQFSPTGDRVVFSSTRSGYREIWICNRDGSDAIQLTDLKSQQSSMPSWSPDGSLIAFQSFVGGERQIFVVSSKGGRPKQLTFLSQNTHPTWSRDGVWIYFGSARSESVELWRVSSLGGEPQRVAEHSMSYAFESDDGQTVYMVDGAGLWAVQASGGKPRSIIQVEGLSGSNVSVTSEGAYLLTHRRSRLQYFDFESETMRLLAELPESLRPGYSGIAISPDGKTVLFARDSAAESDIMLLEDFR